MIFLPHIYLLLIWIRSLSHSALERYSPLRGFDFGNFKPIWETDASFTIQILLIYGIFLFLVHIRPFDFISVTHRQKQERFPLRLKIMKGGRKILRLCFWGMAAQPFLYLFRLYQYPLYSISDKKMWVLLLVADGALTFLFFYLLVLNGSIRILCTCRSLGVWKRVLFFCFLWIPVVHLFPLKYLSKRAKIELDAEICRFENHKKRDGAMICATKYPILLLHGIGFRDLQYFNYWGRIPKELVRNGALVYYGHQEAWGTIENNGQVIREKIKEVLAQNHCSKVNIIAHSKGGLDARYLISGLHMEEQVASLTTISTPHRGSELLDILNRLPDGIYHFISSLFDKSYARFGDLNPDCYHASKQLSRTYCQTFNAKYPDSPKVYYQSYASYVKHPFGDPMLGIPNLLMYLSGASKNDGLVNITSAKWGHFKKTFVSTGSRGISHGDMIDLKREDYKGFDVIEAYVKIVAELKDMGF
ncbi:esterase/lipase family protein [Parablautia muri]|uniref:Triacylglycerol lipase n=1 Tax=Parablautia muri TaxID=2320879 RepID=A0A9X5BEU8_9FIRM|nr:triacylglycerol lipase [Parablautia muri]NBJ92429.1 triacylglycerol lipase [Parablautia muri]